MSIHTSAVKIHHFREETHGDLHRLFGKHIHSSTVLMAYFEGIHFFFLGRAMGGKSEMGIWNKLLTGAASFVSSRWISLSQLVHSQTSETESFQPIEHFLWGSFVIDNKELVAFGLLSHGNQQIMGVLYRSCILLSGVFRLGSNVEHQKKDIKTENSKEGLNMVKEM